MKSALQRKSRNLFVYRGFGFPVTLINVPMLRVRGVWTPDLNLNSVAQHLLSALARKPSRLTGEEIRFVRHSLSMTLEQFAHRFGVTHPAVIKWEKAGHRPTSMAWAIEKDIRLEALQSASHVKPSVFMKAYQGFSDLPSAKPARISLDVMKAI